MFADTSDRDLLQAEAQRSAGDFSHAGERERVGLVGQDHHRRRREQSAVRAARLPPAARPANARHRPRQPQAASRAAASPAATIAADRRARNRETTARECPGNAVHRRDRTRQLRAPLRGGIDKVRRMRLGQRHRLEPPAPAEGAVESICRAASSRAAPTTSSRERRSSPGDRAGCWASSGISATAPPTRSLRSITVTRQPRRVNASAMRAAGQARADDDCIVAVPTPCTWPRVRCGLRARSPVPAGDRGVDAALDRGLEADRNADPGAAGAPVRSGAGRARAAASLAAMPRPRRRGRARAAPARRAAYLRAIGQAARFDAAAKPVVKPAARFIPVRRPKACRQASRRLPSLGPSSSNGQGLRVARRRRIPFLAWTKSRNWATGGRR